MNMYRVLVLGISLGVVIGILVVAEARDGAPSRQAAEQIAAEADRAVTSMYPKDEPQEQQRNGIFVLVSASLGVEVLQTIFDESRLLGATVVFRGWPKNDFKQFATLVRTVVVIPDTLPQGKQALTGMHPANVVLDPVLFEEVNVLTVPALIIREGENWLAVTGGGTVKRQLITLARSRPEYQPLLRWFERRTRGWLQGGKTTEPRPDLPKITATGYGATGTAGTPVSEESLIAFMKRKVAGVNWEQKSEDMKRRVSHQLQNGPGLSLPSVKKARRFLVDPTVTLPDEVHDTEGRLLVESGTVVNPLDFIHLRKQYVVFNGTESGQVTMVQQLLEREGRHRVSVMITEGDVEVLSGQLEAPVFWASPQIVAKFQLVAVPSVVQQSGDQLQIDEVVF